MRRLLFLISLLTTNLTAFSQSDIAYFDQKFRSLPGKEGAGYYKVTQFQKADKSRKSETTFFITGEKYIESVSQKTVKGNFLYEGPLQKWYKNGQLYYTTQYKGGKQVGEALGYYPSGNLKRREVYADGKLVKGESFKEDGTPEEFYAHEVRPEFPGGSGVMTKFLSRNIIYPSDAMQNGKEGSVVVQFEIDETGKIGNAEIVRNVYPSMDKEALRVVLAFPDFKPAMEEGVAKAFTYTSPINFRITNNSYRNTNSDFDSPNSPNNRSGQGSNRRF